MGMSIDEAIERYESNAEYERTHGNLQGCLEFRQLAEWLTELKKLREQTRWIPVSERLPKKTGWYLITFKTYDGDYAVCEMCYRKPENYWTDKNISKKVFDNNEVEAWMPKPKPYVPQERSDRE